jgi:hypothetical protein
VAAHLPANWRQLVFEAVLNIREERVRGQMLAVLVPGLAKELLPAALEAAQAIKDPFALACALTALAARLPAEEAEKAVQRALDVSLSLPDSLACSLLEGLAPVLPGNLLPRALQAATKLNWSHGRRAVEALISRLPTAPLAQALRVALAITSEDQRGAALASLAPVLQGTALRQALQAAQGTLSGRVRIRALAKLAERLEQEERDAVARQSFDDVQAIQDDNTRGVALSWLVTMLPADLLPKALEVARGVEEPIGRVGALAWLAKVASRQSSQQQEIAREALSVAQSIPDENKRREILVWLASRLPEDQLKEVFLAVQKLTNPWEQGNAWKEMAPHLPERVLGPALQAAERIAEQEPRGNALAALAPRLPSDLLSRALQATKTIGSESARMEVVAALAHRAADLQTDDLRSDLLRDALRVPETVTRPGLLKYLGQLVPLLELVGSKDALVELRDAIDDVARWWW